MKLKKILACTMAGAMVLGSLSAVSASDSLTGSGWWTNCQTSTAVSLADGESVSFKVEVSSDTLEAGDYAAFCVEANDGTSYFTATSDGDCWGAGTDTDATSTGAVIGGIYMVTISRSGNNFAADIVDYDTGASILANAMYLEGTSEFGTTTCYIMTQVGNLEVSEIVTDSLTGSGWWTNCQTSTAVSLADGESVSFTVDITSDSLADGEYAAFCVEAQDGTNYFTGTSDGDCWGAGTDTDGTSTGAVIGGSYTVTISRNGNNFTAHIWDNSTGSSILSNPMSLEGTTDFGATTCYIMTQVGNLTVSTPAIAVAAASTDDDNTSEDTSDSDTSEDTSDSDTSEDTSDTETSEDTSDSETSEDTSDSETSEDTSDSETSEDTSDSTEESSSAESASTTKDSATSVTGTSVADVICGTDDEGATWWINHSASILLENDSTTTIKFTNTSTGSSNWNTGIYVIYTADEVFEGGSGISDTAGYTEYYVCRSDVYGWDGAGAYGTTTLTTDSAPADDEAWAEWLAACQSGQECTITAMMEKNCVTIVFTVGDAQTTAYIPVDTDLPVYLSLTGELCELTNISYTVSKTISATDGATSDFLTSSSDSDVYVYEVTVLETTAEDYLTVVVKDDAGNKIVAKSNGTCTYEYSDGELLFIDIDIAEGSAITLEENATYTINVDRDGDTFLITYWSSDGELLLSYLIEDTDIAETSTSYMYAEGEGTYTVIASVEDATGTISTNTSSDSDSDSGDDNDSNDDSDDSDDDSTTSDDDSDSSTASTGEKTTSDASAVAPIVIAMLGCAIIALVSKRKMA